MKGPSRRRGNLVGGQLGGGSGRASMKGPSRRRGNRLHREPQQVQPASASMKGPSRRRGNSDPFFLLFSVALPQ